MLSKLRSGRQVVRGSDENNEGLCKRTGRVGVDGPNTDLEPSKKIRRREVDRDETEVSFIASTGERK